MKKKEGLLFFHQGWTDIFNCLPIINYYSKIYDLVYILIRPDAINILNFYIKKIYNCRALPLDKKKILDKCLMHRRNGFHFLKRKIIESEIIDSVKIDNIDFLGIGCSDRFEHKKWVNKEEQGRRREKNINKKTFFVESFYVKYKIPYILRVENFIFERNLKLEEEKYQSFIKKHGTEYILYHQVIENYDTSKNIVNLKKISDVYFDMITILQNSIEMHLLDSSWGAFVYLLDAKYSLFKNKKIFLYAKRGYVSMFTKPVLLNNWTIIS